MNIPELPIQILAVTETTNSAAVGSAYASSITPGSGLTAAGLESLLINEGNHLADRLNSHFMTSTSAIQQKSSFYTPFFNEVYEKKTEIEQAFSMEDAEGGSSRLDDSGEGTLERPMRRQPMPPPR